MCAPLAHGAPGTTRGSRARRRVGLARRRHGQRLACRCGDPGVRLVFNTEAMALAHNLFDEMHCQEVLQID